MTINDTFPLCVEPKYKKIYRCILVLFVVVYYSAATCLAPTISSEEVSRHEAFDEYSKISDIVLQHAEQKVRTAWNVHVQGARNFELISSREVVPPAQQRNIYKKIDALVTSTRPGALAVLDALVEYYKSLISVNYLRLTSVRKNETVDEALGWLGGFGKFLIVQNKGVNPADFVQQKAAFVKLSMKFTYAARSAWWQKKVFSWDLYANIGDFLEPFNALLPACEPEHVTARCCRCCSLHVLRGMYRGVASHGFLEDLSPKDVLVRVALASGCVVGVAFIRRVLRI